MFREPWFRIIEVTEAGRRSIADIAAETGIPLAVLRGRRGNQQLSKARIAAYIAVHRERPDMSSEQVARFFRRDGGTIRKYWRKEAA